MKLQVKKSCAQCNNSVYEVKVHLYHSTDSTIANQNWNGQSASAPVAQTTADETDTASSTTLSAGLYRAGTLNRMLTKVENDESITTLGQVISNEEVPVVYNAVNTLADDNINSYYVETLTIKSTSWTETITLPVYDNNGNPYYYWIVEDTDSVADYNVSYTFADGDGETNNCINTANNGNGEITVTNSMNVSVILPETGGSGTHGYIVTGGAVVLLSAAVLLLKHRKKKA